LGHTVEERLTDSVKKWIGYGKDKFPNTKKPENVSGKRDLEPPEKKKLTEGITQKQFFKAIKIINEEMTVDMSIFNPDLPDNVKVPPKFIKPFMQAIAKGQKDMPKPFFKMMVQAQQKKLGKGSGDKGGAVDPPSKFDKALDKAVENPKVMQKLFQDPEKVTNAAQAELAAAQKRFEKYKAKKAPKKITAGQHAIMKVEKKIVQATEVVKTAFERDPGNKEGMADGPIEDLKELVAKKNMLEKQMEKLGIPKFR